MARRDSDAAEQDPYFTEMVEDMRAAAWCELADDLIRFTCC
jgi:hypothetical protein